MRKWLMRHMHICGATHRRQHTHFGQFNGGKTVFNPREPPSRPRRVAFRRWDASADDSPLA